MGFGQSNNNKEENNMIKNITIKSSKIVLSLVASTCIFTSVNASAGVYTDQLSKCLVESTSVKDRNQLVRWMFSAASKHHAVMEIVKVTPEMLEQSNKDMGELMNRLLTESCKTETAQALKFEGQATMEASFSVLGQVAGREMFSNPEVAAGMASLEQYIDSKAIEELMQ